MSLTDQNQQLSSLLNKLNILPYTAYTNIVRQIKTMLDKGADINTADDNGNTLLHLIVSNKNLRAYRAYINQSLGMNQEAKALYMLDLPTLITNYRPNPFILNKNGLTASFLAAQNNFTQENAMLLSYENLYQATQNASSFQAISTILAEQCYKKREEIVSLGGENVIVERYQATHHQPEAVLIAHSKLKQMDTLLSQQIHLGIHQKND